MKQDVTLGDARYKKLRALLQWVASGLTNPLSAALDAGNQAIKNVRTLTFHGELDNGNSGAGINIDWTAAQKQKLTLTAAPAAITFTSPVGVTNVLLRLVQDAGGGKTAAWPASVKWVGGAAPVLSIAPGAVDIVSFYFDGVNFFGTFGLGFA